METQNKLLCRTLSVIEYVLKYVLLYKVINNVVKWPARRTILCSCDDDTPLN